MANGNFGIGDINTPYYRNDNLENINTSYGGIDAFGGEQKRTPPSPSEIPDMMDDEYTPATEDTVYEQGAGGGLFASLLGSGVDIYDPQSIASSLMDKYGVGGLTPGMFPAMSKELMASSQASTYDPYKRMLSSPEKSKYRSEISSSAGLMNPNKKRQRAMRAFRAGLGDINRSIFAKTSLAGEGIKDWLGSALSKVMKMKY